MDALQLAFNRSPAGWTAVPTLLICMWMLIAWFPGHNAQRWDHTRQSSVRFAGCAWGVIGLILAQTDLLVPLAPLMIGSWLGLVVWSYGKSMHPVVARSRRTGFEVIPLSNQDDFIPLLDVAGAAAT